MPAIRLAIIFLLAPLGGCALSQAMPPFAATRSYALVTAAGPAEASSASTRSPVTQTQRITREHDDVTNQTRISVTTHKGSYFLWIQRPRVTFFYVYEGTSFAHTPATILLVFRTVNPQVPSNNHLVFTCDGNRQDLGITPTFWLEPGAMTTSRHYMYEIPTAVFDRLLTCSSPSITVGDVSASLASDRLEALRAFAAGMHAP
jgi:hypothetical protein